MSFLGSNSTNKRGVLRLSLALSLVAALFMLSVYFTPALLANIQLRFNDLLIQTFSNNEKLSDEITLIVVDEKSVNQFGRWPWRRDLLAEGIEKLSQSRVILLDMVFSETSNPESDQKLAETLAQLENAICGFFHRNTHLGDSTTEQREILLDSSLELQGVEEFIFHSFSDVEVNIPQIAEACALQGSITILSDADSLIRNYSVLTHYDNQLYPSFALQALRLALHAPVTGSEQGLLLQQRIIPIDKNGRVHINYYPKNDYTTISFSDLFNADFDPSQFKDQYTFVGITEAGITDVRSTPMGQIPGVYLHATFLSNYLNDELLRETERLSYLFIIFMVVSTFFIAIRFNTMGIRFTLYSTLFLLYFLITIYLLQQYRLVFDYFSPFMSLLFATAVSESLSAFRQQHEKRIISDAFSGYLSPHLMQQIINNPDKLNLGGGKKEISILFSDIRNFTTISENTDPTQLVKMINKFFDPMTHCIMQRGGFIDKFIGDAIMALFNAPVDVENHADAACNSALDMIQALNGVNRALAEMGFDPIQIGIGLNSGPAVVGNMGATRKFNYTAIGDSVNLTARLEGATKNYGVHIILSEFMKIKISDHFLTRYIDRVRVKGKKREVAIYQLLEKNSKNIALVEAYSTIQDHLKRGDRKEAYNKLAQLSKEKNDGVSRFHLLEIDKNPKKEEPWERISEP